MKLLWLDCETNSLDPNAGRLLEVAAFVTDLRTPFEVEGGVVQAVLPVAEGEARTFSPFIVEMHTKNGLLAECAERDHEMGLAEQPNTRGLVLPEVARYRRACLALEDELLARVPDKDVVGKEEITALAGSSVHFDRGFLAVHMPRLARQLSHRCYDVSAVKLFCRSLGMPKPPPEEAHRALPDIQESMRHAKLCAGWLTTGRKTDCPVP
jgi:oligoribonuclease